jgi:hypothetical protein
MILCQKVFSSFDFLLYNGLFGVRCLYERHHFVTSMRKTEDTNYYERVNNTSKTCEIIFTCSSYVIPFLYYNMYREKINRKKKSL